MEERHIKPTKVKEAYELGARWNPKKNVWMVNMNTPGIRNVISKKQYVIDLRDCPELQLDDRIDAVVDEHNPIQNIFICNTYYHGGHNKSSYIYYRANCICELCKTPIKENISHIVYEKRCCLYRSVCNECYDLVMFNLSRPITPGMLEFHASIRGISQEELCQILVDMENGDIE